MDIHGGTRSKWDADRGGISRTVLRIKEHIKKCHSRRWGELSSLDNGEMRKLERSERLGIFRTKSGIIGSHCGIDHLNVQCQITSPVFGL